MIVAVTEELGAAGGRYRQRTYVQAHNGKRLKLVSVTIEVAIPDDLVPLLEQKARRAGLGYAEYVRAIVSRDLSGPRSLDEILKDVRNEVTASGISDGELTELFESARGETPSTEQ